MRQDDVQESCEGEKKRDPQYKPTLSISMQPLWKLAPDQPKTMKRLIAALVTIVFCYFVFLGFAIGMIL
ncbi:MAG TPA: hypothetical protein DCW74_06725 [Alteromonas australica]|uniref:Uncharacterized protein n=1 Tax=Alteromonas australica TaxID=589873 RepID=A0A350P297_9ALTE|nr:hypothetical protein [Alteromonas australica]